MARSNTSDIGISRETFFGDYGAALENGNAAVFAGAGLSRAAGFVDWKGLLREIADEVGLDIDLEQDLAAVAQYHLNANNRDRSRLNQLLMNEFSKEAMVTPSHIILARLPIHTFWTSNYDRAIEQAMTAGGRKVDVKVSGSGMTTTQPGRDAVLYKMHGDLSDPASIIITTDDYVSYSHTHSQFLSSLQADLANKTFLFLGFSFTDPNLNFILGRIRAVLHDSPRTHFTIMRREQRGSYRTKRQFEYEANRQNLRIKDLHRYGIQTVLVDDYDEIPKLLEELERRYFRRNIVVSGAAFDSGPLGQNRLEDLCRKLGARIIFDDYNLVSGFGIAIGSPVIMGALETIYTVEDPIVERRLRLRPFPQVQSKSGDQDEVIRKYRRDLIAGAGFVIFVAGNKKCEGEEAVVSSGMLEEFNISQELKLFPIPVAASGWAAKQIWEEVNKDFNKFFPAGTPVASFVKLADKKASNQELVEAAFALIHHLTPRVTPSPSGQRGRR